MTPPKLKVGLLLDGDTTPAWAATMISRLLDSDYAEITLLVQPANTAAEPMHRPWWNKLWRHRQDALSIILARLLARAYTVLIERSTYLPASEAPQPLDARLTRVPRIQVKPLRSRWSDRFEAHDVAAIREHDLDVLIRLGFRILRGDVLQAARHGIWSLHHGDPRVNRGGPAGFWESLESWPVTGSVLQILNEDMDNGQILCRSWSSTNTMSVLDNRRSYFWKSASFVPRMLERLHAQGSEHFYARLRQANGGLEMYSNRLFSSPRNGQMAALLVRKLGEKIRCLYDHAIYQDQWGLMFDWRDDMSSAIWRYRRIVPPLDRFWADPHALLHHGRHFIFIEEFVYAQGKGHIAVMELHPDGSHTVPVPVLERPYHLSYPFVFEHQGQVFMVPESAANASIEMYRCIEFPHRWALHKVLMQGVKAYDSTLYCDGQRWWLFANMVETEGASSWDELFLFHADAPDSDRWVAHPLNPIVSDCQRARPAGPLFAHDGQLYRPSQNCALRYGHGFNLSRVTCLTPEDYREELCTEVKPGWADDVRATHTFGKVGRLHVVDAQFRHRR
jgi:hypothetical protein